MGSRGSTHLRVTSGYSARYGASLPHALVQRAAERGMTTLALTDRDTVAGTVRFAKAAAAAGIRPVFGVDVAVAPHHPARPGVPRAPATARAAARRRRDGRRTGPGPVRSRDRAGPPGRLGELAQDRPGHDRHAPVRRGVRGGHETAQPRERLRLEAVYLGRQGTGAGSLGLAAHRGPGRRARRARGAVERRPLCRPCPAPAGRRARCGPAAAARRPPAPGRRRALAEGPGRHDGGRRADRPGRRRGPRPGRSLLAETADTGQSCTLTPAELGRGQTRLPEASVVGAIGEPGSAMRLLRQRCESGMVARGLARDERAVRQLAYELECIGRLSYEGYYLVVTQAVADTRALGIRVAARGSGAGSIVDHTLFVATANPLEHHLSFKRHLQTIAARHSRTSTSTWSPIGVWRCTT
ncbi:PHP domain-containing protein [Streptomyces vulcanius]|uniref:PHP domain-containing protein n=1 Tax=Streptomyces vulcanius TaxID=1441876 RepID=UPI003AA9D5CF